MNAVASLAATDRTFTPASAPRAGTDEIGPAVCYVTRDELQRTAPKKAAKKEPRALTPAQREKLAAKWLDANRPDAGLDTGYLLRGKSAEQLVAMFKAEYPGADALQKVGFDPACHSVIVALALTDEKDLEIALFDDRTGRATALVGATLVDVQYYGDEARAIADELFGPNSAEADWADLLDKLLDQNPEATILGVDSDE